MDCSINYKQMYLHTSARKGKSSSICYKNLLCDDAMQVQYMFAGAFCNFFKLTTYFCGKIFETYSTDYVRSVNIYIVIRDQS